jgi:hypothetical protein
LHSGEFDNYTPLAYNPGMPIYHFELLSKITDIEIIAVDSAIREIAQLRKQYGGKRWRKLKGKAYVRLQSGEEFWAEVHYYECHGIGRHRLKIKLPEDDDE